MLHWRLLSILTPSFMRLRIGTLPQTVGASPTVKIAWGAVTMIWHPFELVAIARCWPLVNNYYYRVSPRRQLSYTLFTANLKLPVFFYVTSTRLNSCLSVYIAFQAVKFYCSNKLKSTTQCLSQLDALWRDDLVHQKFYVPLKPFNASLLISRRRRARARTNSGTTRYDGLWARTTWPVIIMPALYCPNEDLVRRSSQAGAAHAGL